ncbi:hypothetical protein [uncultured Methanobrevibacter sp.]|uniref:hypothetical protein n=1 Tax=uncultured Methanobrevibacter sp. TaxID=253161 RepID=UPI0025D44E54|nr:hypothetical protein [uncultured Methanobrevibacter sp.]
MSIKDFNSFVNEGLTADTFDTEACKDEIVKQLKVEPVSVDVSNTDTWGDKYVRVTLRYIKEKDYPSGLKANDSVFVFDYLFSTGKLELRHDHFYSYLSPYDKTHDHKNMAMRSAISLAKECGVSTFRKTAVKSEKDIADKICKFINKVMDIVVVYTGGYPYHESNLEVSIADAMRK